MNNNNSEVDDVFAEDIEAAAAHYDRFMADTRKAVMFAAAFNLPMEWGTNCAIYSECIIWYFGVNVVDYTTGKSHPEDDLESLLGGIAHD